MVMPTLSCTRFRRHQVRCPMAGGAAWTPPNDRTGLRRCEPHHLFFADCTSIRRRALLDPANITRIESQTARCEIAENLHSSLYAPREFDISSHFMVVKPTLVRVFNYKDMYWADLPRVHTARVHDGEPGSPS
jgi:hypothetical protein